MNPVQHYLFIDIETVSTAATYSELSPAMQQLWAHKCHALKAPPDADYGEMYEQRAGVYSEFAKVVCISLGCIVKKDENWKIYIKSLSGDNEQDLLSQFVNAVSLFEEREKVITFCGHNIKEFDIPFLCRRMVINSLQLPSSLDVSGKKPWEVNHEDTMEMWRFGDKKSYTQLALLAEILDIPTPKDDINGSMVGEVYWKEKNLQRIADYCGKDVVTVAKVFLRLKGIKIPELDVVQIA